MLVDLLEKSLKLEDMALLSPGGLKMWFWAYTVESLQDLSRVHFLALAATVPLPPHTQSITSFTTGVLSFSHMGG